MKILMLIVLTAVSATHYVSANGVLRWGFGARDTGSAGAFGGTDGDAITTLHVNPALLSTLPDQKWTLSTRYLRGNSTFKRGGTSSSLHDGEGAYPDFALALGP